jgi:hypothetical protein
MSAIKKLVLPLVLIAVLGGMFGQARFAKAQDPQDAAANCLVAGAPGCTHGLPTFQYEMLLGQMAAHPIPNVREIEVDNREIRRYSFYRVNRNGATIYDAPGGNAVGSIAPGFNYVGARRREGDWIMIREGQWIPLSDLQGTRASSYAGVLTDGELPFVMAWALVPIRPSAIPGEEPAEGTAVIPRYTRFNIFATVKVGDWEWYLIGPGQWVEQRQVARALPVAKPEGVKGRWFAVDLYEQVLIAYEEDRPVFATLISSGLPQWSTNEGLFRIWARARADSMTGAMGQPDFYSLQAVPYVMYFDNAISLHGTYWHDGFGYRHSHGCVNMSVSDARWVYEWTDNFYFDTWVYVWASGEY